MSIRLSVAKFSCIEQANLELSPLTVLIGPQASGKSVVSKLVHFFFGLLNDQFLSIEDMQDVSGFKETIKTKFKEWFPVEAWGPEQFCIEFTAGDCQFRLTRSRRGDVLGENMRVTCSSFFEKQYGDALRAFVASIESREEDAPDMNLESFWKIRDAGALVLRNHLGPDFLEYQLFIPAGRSFFTSVGKTIAAFEQGRVLDPLTTRFGRLFGNLRERASAGSRVVQANAPWVDSLTSVMGGELVFQRDKEFLQTKDGRKVPFASMSSGQQELMPLLLTTRSRSTSLRRFRQLITIEEPEAHLFPAAQSTLVEAFSSMVSSSNENLSLLLTTHSPYVLAKLNNLIKAYQVGKAAGETAARKVARIVPSRSWLNPEKLTAYAIHEGKLVRINSDEDALINATYLDEVSGQIAREFNELLALEVTE